MQYRAELAVGRALRAVRASPFIQREMLFVSTKAGFMQDHLLKGLKSAGKLQDTDVAAGSHCIAPACLQASLTNSLTSLSLQTVRVRALLQLRSAQQRGHEVSDCITGACSWLCKEARRLA